MYTIYQGTTAAGTVAVPAVVKRFDWKLATNMHTATPEKHSNLGTMWANRCCLHKTSHGWCDGSINASASRTNLPSEICCFCDLAFEIPALTLPQALLTFWIWDKNLKESWNQKNRSNPLKIIKFSDIILNLRNKASVELRKLGSGHKPAIYTCMYIHIYIHIYIYMYIHIYMSTYMYMYTYVYV